MISPLLLTSNLEEENNGEEKKMISMKGNYMIWFGEYSIGRRLEMDLREFGKEVTRWYVQRMMTQEIKEEEEILSSFFSPSFQSIPSVYLLPSISSLQTKNSKSKIQSHPSQQQPQQQSESIQNYFQLQQEMKKYAIHHLQIPMKEDEKWRDRKKNKNEKVKEKKSNEFLSFSPSFSFSLHSSFRFLRRDLESRLLFPFSSTTGNSLLFHTPENEMNRKTVQRCIQQIMELYKKETQKKKNQKIIEGEKEKEKEEEAEVEPEIVGVLLPAPFWSGLRSADEWEKKGLVITLPLPLPLGSNLKEQEILYQNRGQNENRLKYSNSDVLTPTNSVSLSIRSGYSLFPPTRFDYQRLFIHYIDQILIPDLMKKGKVEVRKMKKTETEMNEKKEEEEKNWNEEEEEEDRIVSVLDVGCASGVLSLWLHRMHSTLFSSSSSSSSSSRVAPFRFVTFGFDSNPAASVYASYNAQQLGLSSNSFCFRTADLHQLHQIQDSQELITEMNRLFENEEDGKEKIKKEGRRKKNGRKKEGWVDIIMVNPPWLELEKGKKKTWIEKEELREEVEKKKNQNKENELTLSKPLTVELVDFHPSNNSSSSSSSSSFSSTTTTASSLSPLLNSVIHSSNFIPSSSSFSSFSDLSSFDSSSSFLDLIFIFASRLLSPSGRLILIYSDLSFLLRLSSSFADSSTSSFPSIMESLGRKYGLAISFCLSHPSRCELERNRSNAKKEREAREREENETSTNEESDAKRVREAGTDARMKRSTSPSDQPGSEVIEMDWLEPWKQQEKVWLFEFQRVKKQVETLSSDSGRNESQEHRPL